MQKQKYGRRKYVFSALATLGLLIAPLTVHAATDSESTTINVSLGSTISITTSGAVAISVTPTGAGAMSSDSDSVLVSTNNAAGYTLTLADADADTDLVNGGNTIEADAGTQASPTSGLTNNRWGYRVDGIGGFGAGATSAETNVSSSAYSWAGVPATGSPNTIATTASAGTDDETIVWFGIRATTANPNGTYSDTVTYTATTN